MKQSTFVALTLLIAITAAFAMMASNSKISFLEDETTILAAATAPVADTVMLFVHGGHQHEHPPLSDIILHGWLRIAHGYALLRLPSILFFAGAIVVFAHISRRLAGPMAGIACAAIMAASPFTFHFARLAGWYSFCLLLIGLITLCYLRWQEQATWARWSLLVLFSVALVYSNYYGLAVLTCIAVDAIRTRGSKSFKYLAVGIAAVAIAFLPLIAALASEFHHPNGASGGLIQRIALGGYGFYVTFVSESVAPWVFWLSIPAGAAIFLMMVLMFQDLDRDTRWYVAYFAALFGGLIVVNAMNTKRLLFISGWLFVALAVAVARSRGSRRVALLACIVVAFSIGWFGIVNRTLYASAHFVEPWQTTARGVLGPLSDGATVASNSPSFMFYMHQEMAASGSVSDFRPVLADGANVIRLLGEVDAERYPSGKVVYVRGTNTTPASVQQVSRFEEYLNNTCSPVERQVILRDRDSQWKRRFFGGTSADRVVESEWNCPTQTISEVNLAR